MTRRKGVECFLWLCAFLCLVLCGIVQLWAHQARRASFQIASAPAPSTPIALASNELSLPAHVSGRLEIKRLDLSVPILSHCDDQALRLGSCHIQGTAQAGGLGNMGIAGHRDGSFRPVRNIRPGDVVDVFGASGHFVYTVTRTSVVLADDTSVLAVGETPELTLITCYPFHYVGPAPERFVVHARLRSVDAESD